MPNAGDIDPEAPPRVDSADDYQPSAPTASTARSRWLWGKIAAALFAAFLLLVVLLANFAPVSKSLQPITSASLTLLSAEGIPIARRGAVLADPVSAAKLPKHVLQPFIAIEDRRFYSHIGVDPRGIARAIFNNVRAGEVVEGGSTISQQLAKLSFLSSDQTVARKLQEAVLALWLEAWLSKDEILSRYLSSVYFGDNVFGLRAAASHYFNKAPERLTVGEAAMLAGLVKAPSHLNPTNNPEGARERTATVISAMVDAGMLTAAQARRLPPVRLKRGPAKNLASGTYFADWAFPQAEALLEGGPAKHQVKTTLEDRLQRAAAAAIRETGIGPVQVALVAIRPDGRVVAMIGGKNYKRSQFNRATQARRQAGSTFKLFVYLAAFRAGYTPDDPVSDTPLRIGDWSPDNHEGHYRGSITLREAFAVSSNVAAVRLAEAVGRGRIVQAARDLGLTGRLEQGSTLPLGTSSGTLMELVSAYAAVAAGRFPVVPRGVLAGPGHSDRIAPMGGKVRKDMLDLLRAVVERGSGRGATLPVPAFGKTGTSQDSRDAYFIGFADGLIAGVWLGFDDNRPMHGVQGGGLPAQVWRNFMMKAIARPSAAVAARPTPTRQTGSEPAIPLGDYDVEEGDIRPSDGNDGLAASAPPDMSEDAPPEVLVAPEAPAAEPPAIAAPPVAVEPPQDQPVGTEL